MMMKYYKDPDTAEVYSYDESDVENGWVREGLVEMTDAEVKLHLNPPVSDEQLLEEASARRLALRLAADSEIEWRQDAVDAGIATAEETADLAAWKKYRVLLMRVVLSNPEWPLVPES